MQALEKTLKERIDNIRSWHLTYMEEAAYSLGDLDATDEELYENCKDHWKVPAIIDLFGARIDELEKELKELKGEKIIRKASPTKEFILELIEQAKIYGHCGDWCEISEFVEEVIYSSDLDQEEKHRLIETIEPPHEVEDD